MSGAYTPCQGLWCISTYFNPRHYRTRQQNHTVCAERLRGSGIPLLTVECAFGTDAFELPPAPDVLQVRSPDVLWQKERLINLATARLPDHVSKVAWLDDDILFTNPDWAVEAARRLEETAVVQIFTHAIRLQQGRLAPEGDESSVESFASILNRNPSRRGRGGYHAHGHTGFAWAARGGSYCQRRHGLYEAFLNGVGDDLMAHALADDLDGQYIRTYWAGPWSESAWSRLLCRLERTLPERFTGRSHSPFYRHFMGWARPVAMATQGRIGCVTGDVLHLWHGQPARRQHKEGRQVLHKEQFDPPPICASVRPAAWNGPAKNRCYTIGRGSSSPRGRKMANKRRRSAWPDRRRI